MKLQDKQFPSGLRICAHLVRLELSKLAKIENLEIEEWHVYLSISQQTFEWLLLNVQSQIREDNRNKGYPMVEQNVLLEWHNSIRIPRNLTISRPQNDANDQQNLIQYDKSTTNPDNIDQVQTNNNSELQAREGENLEEEESSDEESAISTNTENSNSDPFPIQTTRSGRVISTPQWFNFESNLILTATITKFLITMTLKRKTLTLQLYEQQLDEVSTIPVNKNQSNSKKWWLDPIKKNGWNRPTHIQMYGRRWCTKSSGRKTN